MKLTRNTIFSGILIFGLVSNTLVLADIQFLLLRAIFSFIFLTIVPGLLLTLALRIEKIDFWEHLVYSIGLSVAVLMFGGFLVNWALPLFGISQPLSLAPILASLNALTLVIGLIAYIRNKHLSIEIKPPKIPALDLILGAVATVFPVLSTMGAISLNNSGSNIFTMIMLGGIGVYVLLLIIFRKKINPSIFPLALILIGSSLLLMTSLRGWYVTGHDIQQEYYVFQLTRSKYLWNISYFKDAYNACLSLNILPTIFSSFLHINDLYVFKILFQLIFPFTIVSLYLTFKKYTTEPIAFVSSFYFMSFPAFINDMTSENRQEIALLYFALMLLVLFNKTIGLRIKEILFLIFGFSMIVSHYSTSYVAVALFILTYMVSFVLKRGFIRKRIKLRNKTYYLTGIMIIGLIFFTFLWNTQITQSSGGLARVFVRTWQNMGKAFSQDLKAQGVMYSIFNWQKPDNYKLFERYVAENTGQIEFGPNRDAYYDKSVYEKYKVTYRDEYIIPLTTIGEKLSKLSINVFSLNYVLRQAIAKIIQILVFIGFIVIFLKKSRDMISMDKEYTIMIFVSIMLLGFLIVLPVFSIEYGTGRFFQQTLIVLALPTVIGGLLILRFFHTRIRLYICLAIFIVFFLSLSGFLPEMLGDYYTQIHLNNVGAPYDFYYTHKSEVDGIKWLSKHKDSKYIIQSNYFSKFKMLAITNLQSTDRILPVTVRKDSYVFLDYPNVTNSTDSIVFNSDSYTSSYPVNFLDENKDLIYNNQGAKVYK
jgi:uncharacterized membrane protein